jgi:O-antigen/teichoic acid export membrane protein
VAGLIDPESAPAPIAIPARSGLIAALTRTGGGDLASKAALLLSTVVAARLLEPAAFAVYAGLLAVGLLAAALWDAGISTVVTTAASRGAPTGAILRRVLTARLPTLPVWFAAIALGLFVFGSMAVVRPATVLALAVGSMAASASLPLQAMLRGHLRFGRAAAASTAGRWLAASLTLGLLLTHQADDVLLALFLAQAAGEVTTLVVAVMLVSRSTDNLVDRMWDSGEVGLRRSLPFAANTVLAVAYNRLDLVVVATLTTTAQLAAYTPASRLQDALYLLPAALAAVALPYLSQALAGQGGVAASRAVVHRLWRTGLLLAVPAAAILIVGMPTVIGVLLGSEYAGSVPAARILTVSMILAVIGGPILALLIAAGRGPATTKAFVAAFVASLVLNLSLDWWLGSVGAAIASVSRDVVNVAVAAYCARDLLRVGRVPPNPVGRDPDSSAAEADYR